jgi:hypothetical protein
MFPKSIFVVRVVYDIVLHPDYAKMVGFTSPMLPRKAEEKVEILNS